MTKTSRALIAATLQKAVVGKLSDAGLARAVAPGRGPASESHQRTNPRESGEDLAVCGDLGGSEFAGRWFPCRARRAAACARNRHRRPGARQLPRPAARRRRNAALYFGADAACSSSLTSSTLRTV